MLIITIDKEVKHKENVNSNKQIELLRMQYVNAREFNSKNKEKHSHMRKLCDKK